MPDLRFTITRRTLESRAACSSLRTQLADLLKDTYADPFAQIDPAIQRSNVLFLAEQSAGITDGFVFASREQQWIGGENRNAVYIGLGFVRKYARGSALLEELLSAVSSESDSLALANSATIHWAKTALPQIPTVVKRTFAHVEPAEDGSYSREGIEVARMARRYYHLPEPGSDGEHPFVLRGVSSSRYLPQEARRVGLLPPRPHLPYRRLFDQLGIEEPKGDRMLLTMWNGSAFKAADRES